jgi:AraC family transcriptional regulator of adaptative response / DNA-3-methyladenine glycosylase II
VDLDIEICRRARLARDARFDGRFFVGVHSTGIYCRPVCPAPPARESNVQYFPSAAAAAETGLRPCLRCRPEASPGTPAWNGRSTTVARGLRLIGEGALDEASVEALAARLGVGARHLRRLFIEHLGATPVAIAQTRRLQFAKRLIDETAMPLTEIALASGFRSIRRFNASIQRAYRRPPRELRKLAGATSAAPPGEHVLRLPFRPPLDWAALLDFLRLRAIPHLEEVTEDCYRRQFCFKGKEGRLEARIAGSAVRLAIAYPDARALLAISERVRRMFDLDADPDSIAAHLSGDSALAKRIRKRPGLRIPGAWDGWEAGVRAILGQQVSVRAASTLAGRLVQRFGDGRVFPSPEALAEAGIEVVGLPSRRAGTIRQLAASVLSGAVSFSSGADPDQFRRSLMAIPGIGEWTAQYISLRALGDPNALPAGDLGLRKALGLTATEIEIRSQAWRPWRAYAAIYLWQVEA